MFDCCRKLYHTRTSSYNMHIPYGIRVAATPMWPIVCIIVLSMARLLDAEVYKAGLCQVFSYNIKFHNSKMMEKHFFVCCNNLNEKLCQGTTYQKPTRKESFCSGQVITDKSGSHWTQMETNAFPDDGRFTCGGCCGQHTAWDKCTQKLKTLKWPGCMNWVQCFQTECRSILAQQPLRCQTPPAAYIKQKPPPPPPRPKRSAYNSSSFDITTIMSIPATASSAAANASCHQCLQLDMVQRCRLACCTKYCCLPDGGTSFSQSSNVFGALTPLQIAGIAIGALAFVAALAAVVLLILKRCLPECRNFKLSMTDTQILVIEGPEDPDMDSDQDDST